MLMNEWKKIRTHYIKVELLGMATMALCFGIGVWCDWNVIVKNNVLIAVEDIDAFSLTILQIQASVGTLVIAIIALITGNITDSYMGISISDFYLNIKPWKLTQKRLVFLLLGFSLAGVIFHSFGLYNIVFYMFICTMIGIVISIMGIYSAFRGRNKQNQEIEAYINYVIDYKMDFGSKLNVYQSYVLDWEKQVEFQVHKVVMIEGKRNIIQQLLQEYDIETAEDIQDALKDLLGGTIKEMMEAEMDDHLGYEKSERSDSDDYRNGYKSKRVNSSYGSMDIDVPQNRKSTFEPQVVKKRQKDISDIDQKIISMYAKGMTTRQYPRPLKISMVLKHQKALFQMLQIKSCLRLRTGKTVSWMKCIQSST